MKIEITERLIPEYWIADTSQGRVTVLTLVDGLYEEAIFQGRDRLASATFPNLKLTAAQVMDAGIGIEG